MESRVRLRSKRVAGAAGAAVFAAGAAAGAGIDADGGNPSAPVSAGSAPPKVMPNFNAQQAQSTFTVNGTTVRVQGLPDVATTPLCVPNRRALHAPTRHRLTQRTAAARRLNRLTERAAEALEPSGALGFGAGASGAHVEHVQRYLRSAGFKTLRVDGIYDESTTKAVCNFQASVKLNPTGRIDSGTWAKLSQAYVLGQGKNALFSPPQRKGEVSSGVRKSERVLAQLGLRPGNVDGKFTATTQRASRRYERRNPGNGTNGSIGPGQYKNMQRSLAIKRDPTLQFGRPKRVTGYYQGSAFRLTVKPIGRSKGVGKMRYLRADAAKNFLAMMEHAKRDGVYLRVNEGFRSYAEQAYLYRVLPRGRAHPPGYSNHQRGLSVDIYPVATRGTEGYRWLSRHARKYGFVNDVPSEAWHWTYFGKPNARAARAVVMDIAG